MSLSTFNTRGKYIYVLDGGYPVALLCLGIGLALESTAAQVLSTNLTALNTFVFSIMSSRSGLFSLFSDNGIKRSIMCEGRDTLAMTVHRLNPGAVPCIAIIATLISVMVLIRLLVLDLDPREPPFVNSRVPFIGHIVGLLVHSTEYFSKIKQVASKDG